MSGPAKQMFRASSAGLRNIETRSSLLARARVQPRRWAQRPSARRREWGAVPGKSNENSTDAHAPRQEHGASQNSAQEQQTGRNTQLAATLAQSDSSDLVTEVRIPDDPYGVLPPGHPALAILGNSSLVIQRQLEMMNVMLGFEQANRYIVMDGQGQTLGYIAEQDHGIGSALVRQMARTHRSFTTHIFDAQEREVLRIHRPFTYINSRIRVYDPVPEGGYTNTTTSTALQGTSASSAMNQGAVAQTSSLRLDEMRIIGEAQQQWAPLRRKYNLFTYRAIEPASDDTTTPRIESGDAPNTDTMALTEKSAPDRAIEAGMSQFAHVNEPFLSWDFTLRDENSNTIGSVNRNFVGFAREIFTDTGVYALRMDSAAQMSALEHADGTEISRYEREATAMTLDQRAVMLATAVSIDFDYFSRHSHAGGAGFMPIFWPMGGGGAAAESGAAGTVGTAAEGTAGAVGGAATRVGAAGASEGAIAGAGTMAGYEAMQRGVYGSRGGADDASPHANEPFQGAGGPQSTEQMENRPGNDEVWGENSDPWSGGSDGGTSPPSAGGDGGGGSWLDTISDFFSDQ